MITVKHSFEITPFENNKSITLTDDQLIAFNFWLVLAWHDEEILPFWFSSNGIFATRNSEGIRFPALGLEVLSIEKIEELLCDIQGLSYSVDYLYTDNLPIPESLGHDKHDFYQLVLDKETGIAAYYSAGEVITPVGIRICESMNVWYGVRASLEQRRDFTFNTTDIFQI